MSGTITIDTLKSGTNKQVSVDEIWHSGNDGSGSGLDADLLDGLDSSQFIRSDAADTITGALTSTSTISATQLIATSNGDGTNIRVGDDAWFGDVNISNTTRLMGAQDNAKGYLIFGNGDSTALGRSGTGDLTYGGNTIWHAGNLDSSQFIRSNAGVLAAVATSPAGGVGTYIFGVINNNTSFAEGATYAGSSIKPATIQKQNATSTIYGSSRSASTLYGTWRAMGGTGVIYENNFTLFVRIS